jgi:hypothetical protein
VRRERDPFGDCKVNDFFISQLISQSAHTMTASLMDANALTFNLLCISAFFPAQDRSFTRLSQRERLNQTQIINFLKITLRSHSFVRSPLPDISSFSLFFLFFLLRSRTPDLFY